MDKKTFALFFTTHGISLENWDRLGILERELKLYRSTAQRFKKLFFFTYGTNDVKYRQHLPENIVIVQKPRFLPVLLYSFLLPYIRRKELREVDILKTNQMDGSWTAVLAKKIYGGKLIIRCGYEWLQAIEYSKRGWFKHSFAWLAERYAYRNADAIIHTSHEAAAFAGRRFTIPAEKVWIIPNYIDTELFSPTQAQSLPNSVIYVGRIERDKNITALVEALEGLPVTLSVVGKGSERPSLERLAEEKKIKIKWLGIVPQQQLPRELTACSIFVLPSLHEGNPKTLLEAMSCGMACIATDVIGSREVINDGVDGLLCRTDAISIKYAIQRLLEDEHLRQVMGEHARKTILESCSFDKVFEQELSVYTALQ